MKASKKIIIFVQGFILLNLLWYIAAITLNMNVIPKPTDVYLNLNNLYGDKLYLHVLASLFRISAGLIISLILGIITGLLMAYSPKCNKILNPIVYLTYPIPKTALLPIIMLVFGLGDSSKIILIVFITVFQIIVLARDSALNISAETYAPIKSLGASWYQLLYHITLPAILPGIITSLRVSIGTALSVLFFAEGYGTQLGIGYYILDAWTRIDYLGMYAGIIIMGLLGFILFMLLDILEEFVCRWK